MVGVELRGQHTLFDVEDSLDELELLAKTAGVAVVAREIQRLNAINPGTLIGRGKVGEIEALVNECDLNLVIFDDELSPAQIRNLELEIGATILDRTALILDIFAMHANTREGALQVELAQYAYRLPRLTRQWTHLSRQGVGGVGLRGPGETQLEVDRREISRRMSHLKADLERVRKQRAVQRQRRRRHGLPIVGIVGYTNAGKSTLLNRLANADVLVEDKLFATLDPTTRRSNLPSGKEVLFSDTVGFIQKLPTELVAAFRATLEEVQLADILLHVVDVSDGMMSHKIEAVEQVLDEIEAADKPMVLALNKVDLIDPDTDLSSGPSRFSSQLSGRIDIMSELQRRYEAVVPISAQQGVGVDELLKEIERVIIERMVDVQMILPYDSGDLLSLWHKQGIVDETDYRSDGVHVSGKLPGWLLPIVRGQLGETVV